MLLLVAPSDRLWCLLTFTLNRFSIPCVKPTVRKKGHSRWPVAEDTQNAALPGQHIKHPHHAALTLDRGVEALVFANCQRTRSSGIYSERMNSVDQPTSMRIGQPIPPELPPAPGQAPAEQEPGMPPRPPEPAPFEPAPPNPEPSTVPAPKA